MQLPNELNSKRQDPEDEYKTKMYQLIIITILFQGSRIPFLGANRHWDLKVKQIMIQIPDTILQ